MINAILIFYKLSKFSDYFVDKVPNDTLFITDYENNAVLCGHYKATKVTKTNLKYSIK